MQSKHLKLTAESQLPVSQEDGGRGETKSVKHSICSIWPPELLHAHGLSSSSWCLVMAGLRRANEATGWVVVPFIEKLGQKLKLIYYRVWGMTVVARNQEFCCV